LVALSTKTVKVVYVQIFIEVCFLTAIRSAFCAINSDDFTSKEVSIFKKRNKEFKQIFNPDGLCFLKSDMLW
jgi:hypothetical protein